MIQNKHIIRLSFIGLFLNIIISMILYRYFMIEEIIIKQVANENFRIADIYKQNIWDNNKSAIHKFHNNNYKDLLQDQDFILFIRDSIKFFKNLDSKISLFDMYGDKFITNNKNNISNLEPNNIDSFFEFLINKIDRYFLKELMETEGFKNAFKGISNHVLSKKVIIQDNNDSKCNIQVEKRATVITSYIPIINNEFNNFPVDSVLEIHTDVTDQWTNISDLEQKVFRTFIIIFLIFFIIIIYNTNYAQRVINMQFKTNRELEEAKVNAENENLSKSQFLANVSHELRTPLNAIIGFSEIILADPVQTETKQHLEYIQDINNSGNHLLSIINDILDFSKACADKLTVEHADLDLNKLITSTIRFMKPRADEAKVKLIESLPLKHIVMKADSKRLKQVLLNLLSNAVKFTNENGSVSVIVTINELEKFVYIKVIDNGIGMNQKDIPKALSVFGQIDSELSKKHEGTGLGLPLTKKLVELMEGQFDLKSAIGLGTTITLTFNYDNSL